VYVRNISNRNFREKLALPFKKLKAVKCYCLPDSCRLCS